MDIDDRDTNKMYQGRKETGEVITKHSDTPTAPISDIEAKQGLYIATHVNQQRIPMLIDTGCNVSIISHDIYQQLPADKRPRIQACDTQLELANSAPMKVYGLANMTVCIGEMTTEHQFVIAELREDGIIGTDLMETLSLDPIITNRQLRTPNGFVMCYRKNQGMHLVTNINCTDTNHADNNKQNNMFGQNNPWKRKLTSKLLPIPIKDNTPTKDTTPECVPVSMTSSTKTNIDHKRRPPDRHGG